MNHIIVTKLKFKKRIHPNFLVRMIPFFNYFKIKIGFEFNYRAFLLAYGSSDQAIDDVETLSNSDKIAIIVYGAAIEYCRSHKKQIFFDKQDITDALLMASLQTNEQIGNAMKQAKMPDWLESLVENLPKDKSEGIKKK